MTEIRKIPPVTRFLCGSSLAVSLPVMLHLLSPYKVVFIQQYVTQRYEVALISYAKKPRAHLTIHLADMATLYNLLPRRSVSSHVLAKASSEGLVPSTGGGLNYLFEFIMLYRNSTQLEEGTFPGRSADYAWQLAWACVGMLVRRRLVLDLPRLTLPSSIRLSTFLSARWFIPGPSSSVSPTSHRSSRRLG